MKFIRLQRFLDRTDTLLERLYVPLLSLGVLLIALFARKVLLPFQTSDYNVYIAPWYNFIKSHGGFAALRYDFSNYNPPYLYLLAIATMLPLKPIVAIKGISIIFDFFLAFTVSLLAFEKYANKYIAFLAGAFVLFLPTVLLNSAMWAQSDAIYTSFCLLSLYFMMKKKGVSSCVAAGMALSFKLQAIFFLPVLIIGVIKKEIHALYLLFIPIVFAIALVPALIAGRPLMSLLQIYSSQTGQYSALTMNAPNIYQWVPNTAFGFFSPAGTYFTFGLVLLIFLLIHQFSGRLTKEMLVRSALLLTLIIPFFLPQMHERYFYTAEILSIVYAIYFPRYIYIPVLIQIPVLVSYFNYLFTYHTIPGQYLPFFLLGTISLVTLDFVRQLHIQRQSANNLSASQTTIPESDAALFNDISLLDTTSHKTLQETSTKQDATIS